MTIYRCLECGGDSFSPLTVWDHSPKCPVAKKQWRAFKERIERENVELERARREREALVEFPDWALHDAKHPNGCGDAACHRCYGRTRTVRHRGNLL